SSLSVVCRPSSVLLLYNLQPAHVGLQRIRDGDRSVALLVGLHHGDERTADRHPRAVERMHGTDLPALLGTVAGAHAPRPNRAAVRARGNLAIGALPRQPYLDVVGLLRGKAHVAGAQGDDPIVQLEAAQHFFGAGEHALVLVRALLGRGDRDQLDL